MIAAASLQGAGQDIDSIGVFVAIVPIGETKGFKVNVVVDQVLFRRDNLQLALFTGNLENKNQ